MNLKKVIQIIYLVYTIYVFLLIGTTTLDFFKTFLAIILMWTNYYFFSLGYKLRNKSLIPMKFMSKKNTLLNLGKSTLLLFAFCSVSFSIFSILYYTGQTPLNVFYNLVNNVSNYYIYQNYFRENERYLFSISKVPFILMMFYIKFILLYSYVSFFIIKKDTTMFEKIYLILITLAHLYIGLGRGTNFEFFELLILIIYIVFNKYESNRLSFSKIKPILASLFFGILGIYIFLTGLKARGVNFNPYTIFIDVNYDPNGWLANIFPFLSYIIFRMYGYFGFGFFYVSTYIKDLWFSSFENFISGLIPLGFYLTKGKSLLNIMEDLVYVGVRWHPDIIIFTNNIGYIATLIAFFIIGAFSKFASMIEKENPMVELTNYMILLQMISIPVGNFVFTSSSNQLIVMILLVYWIWRIFVNKKITL